ncbi:MAG: chemotaxis response regulator protein-glutamate methylesterase [Desulfotalea sp.]
MANVKILVVDDTILYRKIVTDILKSIPGVTVIGVAHNGKIALDKIKILKPDLITLDIEMPVMNGIELLQNLTKVPNAPTAIMLSTLTSEGSMMTMKALELGAFDFILKPQAKNSAENIKELTASIKNVLAAYKMINRQRRPALPTGRTRPLLPTRRPTSAPVKPATRATRKNKSEIVTIGVSTGGPNALVSVVSQLPKDLGVPVLIVQHMPPIFTASLAASLDKKSQLTIKEAVDGEGIKNNVVYIAPGGKQMKLVAAANGIERLIKITNDSPENSCKPSADYLFRSVGDYFVNRTTAVIMTGMGADGTKGLQVLKTKGAHVIGQDERSCVVYGMPKSAADAGVVDVVCPLQNIANEIVKSVKGL